MKRAIKTISHYFSLGICSLILIAPTTVLGVGGPEPLPPGVDDLTGPAIVGQVVLTPSATANVTGTCSGVNVQFPVGLAAPITDVNLVQASNLEHFTFSVQGSALATSGLTNCYKDLSDGSIGIAFFEINTVSKVSHPSSTTAIADVVIMRCIDRNTGGGSCGKFAAP